MRISITPNGPNGTVVTTGIPFARGALEHIDRFRLLDDQQVEVPVFSKPTLFWPDGSIRALKVQWYHAGKLQLSFQLGLRGTGALLEMPVQEIPSTRAGRVGFKEPAFFTLLDPAYLVTTGIIPPTTVAGDNDYDRIWYPASFAKRVATTDFETTYGSAWLFDSVSTIYQQTLRTGVMEQLCEAYLEHEFYMAHFEVEAQSTANLTNAYVGRWDKSPGDLKYTYLTPMKLHLALTGDDSWTPQENGVPHASVADRDTFIKTVATKALTQPAIGAPYTAASMRRMFTERHTGFAFQQIFAAYEMTLDPTLLGHLNTAVDNLYNMMTNNPDGWGNHGYLSHSWDAHEGSYYGYLGRTPTFAPVVVPSTATAEEKEAALRQTFTEVTVHSPVGEDYLKVPAGSKIKFFPYGPNGVLLDGPLVKNADGTLTAKFTAPVSIRSNQTLSFLGSGSLGTESMNFEADRVFSPWMQAILADGLWQYYNFTTDEVVKSRIAALLLGFGRAITAYALDGKKMDPALKVQIEEAFGVTVTVGAVSTATGLVPYTRYAATYLFGEPGGAPDLANYLNNNGSFADQHTPEALFQISLALQFETDPAKKAAMRATADAMTRWFSTLGTIKSNHPTRYFNWTNKQNAWGTYEYVTANPDVIDPPEEDPEMIKELQAQIAALNLAIAQSQTTIATLQVANAELVALGDALTVQVTSYAAELDAAEAKIADQREALDAQNLEIADFVELKAALKVVEDAV